MTEDRKKEIALKIVEQMLIDNGVKGAQQIRQDLGNLGKKIDISTDEMLEFYQSLLPKFLGRAFGFASVSLSMDRKFQVQDNN